ncbi:MAG: hypothetical protein ACTHLA_03880 [Asticcacaulis sp.]|uniref:hypothetical protein n=1 Tax=Asticcacaulis sp. TaxID=1872648 RepID=UPI003F7B4AD9
MRGLILAALLSTVGAATAQDMHAILHAGGGLATGEGASFARRHDGVSIVSDGRRTKTCPANKIALAAKGMVHITTRHSVKTYPHGFIGCLDPAQFGGQAEASLDQGVSLKPAASQ